MVAPTLIGDDRIHGDPNDMLLHYALGDLPCFTDDRCVRVAWCRYAHRGVHLLREVTVPRQQRRYVFSPKFEFRVDAAFDDVIRACAERTDARSWITPDLVEGYRALHRLGFAHSYEAWCDGKLAGGAFGVHIGAYASVDSMFYRVSHASKAAYGRALGLLKERGFVVVDSNPVEDPSRNYGEEWVPAWRFDELLREAVGRRATLVDDRPCPDLPWQVRQLLPVARFMRKVAEKLRPRSATAMGADRAPAS